MKRSLLFDIELAEECTSMADPIGDAVAILLEAIEEHAEDARYERLTLAARIQRAARMLEDLQLSIQQATN